MVVDPRMFVGFSLPDVERLRNSVGGEFVGALIPEAACVLVTAS